MYTEGCPACLRVKMVSNLLENPTSENRLKIANLIKCEGDKIISGINLSGPEGKLMKECPHHNTYEGYKEFLLFLNDPELIELVFGEDKIEN